MTPYNKPLGFTDLGGHGARSADILLVEDEPDVRKSLRRLLGSLGHNVKEATSAEEGDVWLTSQRFHVCLPDVELPKMKGLEFLGGLSIATRRWP
ncbi:MAG: response regulator [Longimicrobiales bacterium]|nr:response regulator [Longimicrobiales bacterium]